MIKPRRLFPAGDAAQPLLPLIVLPHEVMPVDSLTPPLRERLHHGFFTSTRAMPPVLGFIGIAFGCESWQLQRHVRQSGFRQYTQREDHGIFFLHW